MQPKTSIFEEYFFPPEKSLLFEVERQPNLAKQAQAITAGPI